MEGKCTLQNMPWEETTTVNTPERVSDVLKYPPGALHGHLYKPMDKLQ